MNFRRILAALMAVLICSGILPFAVFADRSTSVYYVNETGGISNVDVYTCVSSDSVSLVSG